MPVFVFTMQNGITLVADLMSETDDAFIARSPLALTPNEMVRNNVLAHKIFPFTESDIVEINKDKIMFLGTPENDLIDYYFEMVAFYESKREMKLTYGLKGAVEGQSRLSKFISNVLEKNDEDDIIPSNTTIH